MPKPQVISTDSAQGSPSEVNRLELLARDFAARLQRTFPQRIAQDPRAFKKAVLRCVRKELPPRRGRPNDPRIDAAVRMIESGKSARDVLRVQVPGFSQLDTYGRYLAEKGLRAAVSRRRKQKATRLTTHARLLAPHGSSHFEAYKQPPKMLRNSRAREASAPLPTIVRGDA